MTGVEFKIGETVAALSPRGGDRVIRFTVVDRTDKTVTLDNGHRKFRVRVKTREGDEFALPYGQSAMAVVVFAGRDIA